MKVSFRVKASAAGLALAAGSVMGSQPALAGPPYVTDDPVPTDPGKWEIFTFSENEFGHGDLEGATGFDINYGPTKDVQLTATVAGQYAKGDGRGLDIADTEVGVKYRFINDEAAGLQVAVFPKVVIPTARGGGKVAYALPVWFQKNIGKWSLFGGGGITWQSGAGTKDFWEEGVALVREVNDKVSLGVEVAHSGAEDIGSRGATTLGVGGVFAMGGPFSFVASGGPVIENGTGRTGARAYVGLSSNF